MLSVGAQTVVHLTTQTRVLAALLGLAFTLSVLELIRRHKLQERYTLLWLIVGAGLILCGIFPSILRLAADSLGVRDTNVALFAVLIGGLVLLVLHLTVVISRQGEQITRLAQELAIHRSEHQPNRSLYRAFAESEPHHDASELPVSGDGLERSKPLTAARTRD